MVQKNDKTNKGQRSRYTEKGQQSRKHTAENKTIIMINKEKEGREAEREGGRVGGWEGGRVGGWEGGRKGEKEREVQESS